MRIKEISELIGNEIMVLPTKDKTIFNFYYFDRKSGKIKGAFENIDISYNALLIEKLSKLKQKLLKK